MAISLCFPLDELPLLSCGDIVRIQGTVYTARDQAHKRLVESLERGDDLPLSLKGQLIYYCGPTPAREDGLFGSAGPTTSARMDPFTPRLIEAGVVATMGKGPRSEAVREACARHGAVYLLTFGGAGAFLARAIRSQRLVAYPDLGPEAIYELTVEDFPAIVGIDSRGNVLSEGEWLAIQKEKNA